MINNGDFVDIMNFYDQYEVVYQSKNDDDKQFIEDPHKCICRFCGGTSPDVSFKHKAHAIPEFLGNRRVLSKNECDLCNDYFSSSCEDHLAKYLGITRTLGQMKGKNGVPSYKATNQLSRIDVTTSGIIIKDNEHDGIASIDTSTNSLVVKGECQPYRPLSVYKAFVKMALSVLPYSFLNAFTDVVKWIRTEPEATQTLLIKPCLLVQKFIPGHNPINRISFLLLKRKNTAARIPYMQFVLATGNYLFQIVVPCPAQDKTLHDKQITLVSFPTPFDMAEYEFGPIKTQLIDLSDCDLKRDDQRIVTMQFDSY